jgi:hypothetical protein
MPQNLFYSNRFEMGIDTNAVIGSNIKSFIVSSPTPDITLGEILQPTNVGRQAPYAGETLTFGDLPISVLADEDFTSWKQFYDWMIAIRNCKAEDLSTYARTTVINILNNKMNHVMTIKLLKSFPTNLTELEIGSNIQTLDVIYFTVNLKYQDIQIETS